MQEVIALISSIHLNKKFVNTNLVEKSFREWSKIYLQYNSLDEYVDKLFAYFRLIESIDMFEIEQAQKYTKVPRMIQLFDKLQLVCNRDEQKIFAMDELKTAFYHIHPFIYGLMLHFYDLKFSEEIDEKITYLTQWIEEIAYACDAYKESQIKLAAKQLQKA